LSKELIWETLIGGAPARQKLAIDLYAVRALQDMLIEQFCRRFWVFWLWQEIKAGRLENPGNDWWRHEWMRPRDPTMDFGRDTKALLEICREGGMSMRRFSEMHGWDEETEEDNMVAAAVRRAEKAKAAGIDPKEIWPIVNPNHPQPPAAP
jgi:lambda repressor-like predicted transcriptional regulator